MQDALRSWRPARQRIFILPTRAGLGFTVLLLIMWLGAINYNNSLAHMLTFLLVSLAVVTMIHAVRNLRDIDIQAQGLEPVFSGEPVPLPVDIATTDRTSYQLQFACHPQPSQSLNPLKWMRGFEQLQMIDAIDSQRHFATLHLSPRARGRHSVARLRLVSTFPLGLFYSWRYFAVDAVVLVYPAPIGDQAMPMNMGGGDEAAITSDNSGGDDFAGLKNFRPGEPLHGVAWKALARDDVMRSKQFQGQSAPTLWFDWHSVTDPKHEQRISQISRWVVDAHKQGLAYGLKLPEVTVEPDRGEVHYHHCLTTLALLPYAE